VPDGIYAGVIAVVTAEAAVRGGVRGASRPPRSIEEREMTRAARPGAWLWPASAAFEAQALTSSDTLPNTGDKRARD